MDWHDRIHEKAMYRMAIKVFGAENVVNPFCFSKTPMAKNIEYVSVDTTAEQRFVKRQPTDINK